MSKPDPRPREHWEFFWPMMQGRTEVQGALRLCRELDDSALDELLRHHSKSTVDGMVEIERRDVFDKALQAHSLIAVALFSGYFPESLGAAESKQILELLGREPVRKYYEERYPVLLPSLLRLHVAGQVKLPRETSEDAWGGFQWLVRFSSRFERDPHLATFNNLLDGFSYGDLNIQVFLDSLTDSKAALSGFAKPPELCTRRESAALGMLRFLTFCRELEPALRAMEGVPLTQSACWFFPAYWFKGFAEDVGGRAEECLKVLETWLTQSTEIGIRAERDVKMSVLETRDAVTALVDGRYAAPIINRLRLK